MKKIFLHIGAHKTGTSAIQGALGTLQTHGALEKNDFSFALLGDDVHTLCNTNSQKEHFCELFQNKLQNFIENTSVNNFIFSFEGLSSAQILFNTHILDTLKSIFSPYHITIIYYLRRQDNAYESLWAQRHKHFLSPITLNPPKSIYKNVLDLYAHYFGKENICVRIYDKEKLHKKNAIYDFLQCIQLTDLIDIYEKIILENEHINVHSQKHRHHNAQNMSAKNALHENSSLSPSQLRINLSYMRQNRLTPEEIPSKKKQLEAETLSKKQDPSKFCPEDIFRLHGDFLLIEQGINSTIEFAQTLEKLYALGNTNKKNTHAYMPLEMREKFLKECQEENAYIAREYLDKEGDTLFDTQIPQEIISTESPSTDDLVNSFLPMFVHLKQGIDALKVENKKSVEELHTLHAENKKIIELLSTISKNTVQEKSNKLKLNKTLEKKTEKREIIHLGNLKKGNKK